MISWLISRLPFYNSNCSKPNGSASLFGEAQFDNAKPRSAIAPGSRSCRNALPRSCLDITIQMLLGTPPNNGPHPKQCRKSSPHRSFCQIHWERLLDDDKVLHGVVSPDSSHSSQTRRLSRSTRIILMPPALRAPIVPRLQLRSSSAFVGTSTSVAIKQSKLPLPWIEFKAFL